MKLQRIYKTSFEMAHIIKDHPICGVPHGHSYHLTVHLDGNSDTWVDFHDIKKMIQTHIDKMFDHQIDMTTGRIYEASAEQIAEGIAKYLQLGFNQHGTLELFETSKYGVKVEF